MKVIVFAGSYREFDEWTSENGFGVRGCGQVQRENAQGDVARYATSMGVLYGMVEYGYVFTGTWADRKDGDFKRAVEVLEEHKHLGFCGPWEGSNG